MNRFGRLALIVIAGQALGAPVLAQQAQQVAVMQGDAPGEYRALGVVSVETHQKSMFPKVSPQQQLDEALRAEAAKLGADAVIQVKYQMNSALTSKAGNHATGVAVKFTGPTQMAAAAPAPMPTPVKPPVETVPPNAPAPLAAPAPATAPALLAQPPAPPIPAPPASVAAAPAVGAPASARHAAMPAMILLTEQDLPSQRYVRLGEVTAVTHQKSMFPKTPAIDALKGALQMEAAKLGADAVIQVRYTMGNAIMSKQGNQAVGVAVRFE